MSKILNVTTKKELDAILDTNDVVLLYIWTNWCGPCRAMMPIMDNVANDYENVIVVKCDADNSEKLTRHYGIRSVPTIMCFRNGDEPRMITGLTTEDKLIEFCNKTDES